MILSVLTAAGVAAATAGPALAAEEAIRGADLSVLWALPFAGVLLSIAILPLALPQVWHHHYGKIALGWALAFVLPYAALAGPSASAHLVVHAALAEYIPFVILIGTLFTVAGGILVTGNLHGSPGTNTIILTIGTLLASLIGTTGASMVLIRPLLRANDERRHNAHVVVFFIFLVSNIGGSLTPLGDPPLFLGYLKGVDFFWTTGHLAHETVFCALILLALFFVLDSWFYRYDHKFRALADPTPDTKRLGIVGGINFALLAAVVGAVLVSGSWRPGIVFTVYGTVVELQNLVRDGLLVAILILSVLMTPKATREANDFSWGPILEVAKLFAGIFATIIPVIAMLKAGRDGAFAPIVALVTRPDGAPDNAMYFWASGILSSFLDNAPTYLVFFNLAGGDAQTLMGPLAMTLTAMSCGAVFMGANSYIGNAPNFMVKAIAEERGVKMPSFFGYMAWSCGILVPLFALVTWVFFRV
ncbi:sodium:proton antiporter [Prosthecomicrobium hirschii]|uniref:Sodium:proton antiporter n=1 Tax=Prosthecodimorpha hirschii TaxID=665126 RepID=A0A0P6VMQ9_9HYPH|nr:sodium:proton antiporter [Prosthecomicrobium hirschii]KPL54037.1 sodium:proton antiporter [Prosthecomicrobium hirschii]